MLRRWTFAVLCSSLLVSAAAVAACSDDEDTTPPVTTPAEAGSDAATEAATGDSATATTGTLKVDVAYQGTGRGKLYLILLAGSGQPAGFEEIATPTWPGTNTVTFKEVAPGDYTLGGYIDVAGNNPAGPGEEDPSGGGPVTVTPGEQTVAITFADPIVDAGADADADAN